MIFYRFYKYFEPIVETIELAQDSYCIHTSTAFTYSIVKDSSVDLGVNFKIVQNRPTIKAVGTKISERK